MAKPDFSEGYTRIPNLLLERVLLKVSFPAYELRVFFAIMRLSWGWSKRWCYSSYRELAEKTSLDVRNVARTVKALVERRIIVTGPGRNKTRFEINPDYMTWKLPACTAPLFPETTPSVVSRDNATSPETLDRRELAGLLKNFFKELE